MYPEYPEGTQVIVGSTYMVYFCFSGIHAHMWLQLNVTLHVHPSQPGVSTYFSLSCAQPEAIILLYLLNQFNWNGASVQFPGFNDRRSRSFVPSSQYCTFSRIWSNTSQDTCHTKTPWSAHCHRCNYSISIFVTVKCRNPSIEKLFCIVFTLQLHYNTVVYNTNSI